ncbi:hypothetical protein DMC47_21105 [Nostoc sp. 3335mG]|nr:hypothetical protein DMC47_21105 [Nostoc sp. 3335mG]
MLKRWRGRQGPYVTVSYRAQPLDAIRSGAATVVETPLTHPGCRKRCPLERFDTLLRARLAPVVTR